MSAANAAQTTSRPERILVVYDGDSGLRARLLDVVKKAVGREHCPLCEVTHHALGKRGAWRACEARLGVPASAVHRDELPEAWHIPPHALP